MRTFVGILMVVAAGCGGGETEHEVAPAPIAAAAAPAEAAAPAPKPDLALGDGYEMRGVIRDGRLALVPIVATGEIAPMPALTLDEGMAKGKVLVREVRGEWMVDTVRITNRSRVPLLVLRGEIITGAMQDRAIAETRVILAGTTEEVSVRCVEEDRDHGSKRFRTARAMAELALRRTIAHADQSQVWREVAAINERLEIHADTHTYRHAAARHAQGEAKQRADALSALLAAHPDHDRIVGVAVALDGEVLAIDRFASPATFQAVQGKLLGSYVASDFGGVREGRRLTPDAVRALAALPGATAATDASFEALRPLPEPRQP